MLKVRDSAEFATDPAWRRQGCRIRLLQPPGGFRLAEPPKEDSNSMIQGPSLAILARLAVVVLATGVVFAAPRQQAMDDATLSSLTLSDVALAG